jgi:hypothetical protein
MGGGKRMEALPACGRIKIGAAWRNTTQGRRANHYRASGSACRPGFREFFFFTHVKSLARQGAQVLLAE